VDELRVPAHGDHFGPQGAELVIPLCQSGKFGGSDESEVGGIEEQHGPFFRGFQLLQADLAEVFFYWIVHIELEIGDLVPYMQVAAQF
jgi:hypothetical protein